MALGKGRQHRYQLGFGDLAEVGEIGDSWAIFVPDGVTRWLKILAATSFARA
jgi:hypothetical protein